MPKQIRSNLFVIRDPGDGTFFMRNPVKGMLWWTKDINKARIYGRRSDAVQSIRINQFDEHLQAEIVPLTAFEYTKQDLLEDLLDDLMIAFTAGFKAGSRGGQSIAAAWAEQRAGIIAAASNKGKQADA